jgi:hypothetical protein
MLSEYLYIYLSMCVVFPSVCESLPINFRMTEPIFMIHGVYEYIMASEPISTAYIIFPSLQPLCLYVYPSNRR